MKICCVTGHRPQNFPWDYETSPLTKKYLNDMKEIVETLIADGFDYFISGGAIGVDMDFAAMVIIYNMLINHFFANMTQKKQLVTQASHSSPQMSSTFSFNILDTLNAVSKDG